eukprot:RCo031599
MSFRPTPLPRPLPGWSGEEDPASSALSLAELWQQQNRQQTRPQLRQSSVIDTTQTLIDSVEIPPRGGPRPYPYSPRGVTSAGAPQNITTTGTITSDTPSATP